MSNPSSYFFDTVPDIVQELRYLSVSDAPHIQPVPLPPTPPPTPPHPYPASHLLFTFNLTLYIDDYVVTAEAFTINEAQFQALLHAINVARSHPY